MNREPASSNDTGRNAAPLSTEDLMRRHMEDPNHIITDEELSRVCIGTEHINVSEHPMIKALQD